MTVVLMLSGLSFISRDADTIPWNSSRKLIWMDFQGEPDETSSNAALTSSGIEFSYGYSNEKFTYTITCLFDKKKSWGKLKNDYILAHEQGHFDISEIHARKLNKALKEYKFNTASAAKEITAMYKQIMKEQTAMQEEYDAETNHSRDKGQQAAWLEKIRKDLNKLGEYANYH
jgi:Bacterial protein of unknown function (DUF922)